jgi:8-oxo-dGTP diphosphatase
MALYLVRHAKAGSRGKWDGPDDDRPLTEAGWTQARALVARFADVPVSRLLSSPYLRCRQTLEPLAQDADVEVEISPLLAEGGRFEAVLALLDTLPEHAVLCSHGDVIPDTIDALVRRGMTIEGEPEWRKASTWVLDRGRIGSTRARAEAPPL